MTTSMLAILISIALTAMTALFAAVIALLRQSEAKEGQTGGDTTKAATRSGAGACRESEMPERVLDLADWPVLLDMKKVETFFKNAQEHSRSREKYGSL